MISLNLINKDTRLWHQLTINFIIFIDAQSKRIRFICNTPELFGT